MYGCPPGASARDVLLARAAQIDAGFDIGTLAGGPLGSGDIDFPAMIHALAEAGFDGYLVVEHEAHVFVDKRGPAAVLADGHAFAEKLIHGTLPRNRT